MNNNDEHNNQYGWHGMVYISPINDFETEITTVNEYNKSVICRLVFKKEMDMNCNCSIYIYDSDGRYFKSERIDKPIDYYYNLMINNKFNLSYQYETVSFCYIELITFKKRSVNCHMNWTTLKKQSLNRIYEDKTEYIDQNKNFLNLQHRKKIYYNQINEINKKINEINTQMTSIKNEYVFKNKYIYENILNNQIINSNKCNMCQENLVSLRKNFVFCHEYYDAEQLRSILINEYYCHSCLRKNIIAKKCVKCSKEVNYCFEWYCSDCDNN